MKSPKIDTSAADAANAAAAAASAKAEASRQQAELASQNLKKNFATDLSQENLGQVVAGGTASAADTATTVESSLKKKKPQNLSTSLGINV